MKKIKIKKVIKKMANKNKLSKKYKNLKMKKETGIDGAFYKFTFQFSNEHLIISFINFVFLFKE